MKPPQPIFVAHLFPEILDELLRLLASLPAEAWHAATACQGWSVQDVALHVLGVDVGILSSRRDSHSSGGTAASWGELVALVNDWNETWLRATRRISPRLLMDMLRFVGAQVCDYYRSLDPLAMGGPVSWAGPDPAPVWLDMAREYTERWHHQQHIRDAVGKPGLKQPRYLAPVLDAFARALPHTYRDVSAHEGTLLQLTITGPSGGQWFLRREAGSWRLYGEVVGEPHAEAILDEDVAWRLFTRGLSRDAALDQVTLLGDRPLASRVLDMVSIIA